MQVDNPTPKRLTAYFSVLDLRAAQASRIDNFQRTSFLDLGTQSVRLSIHSKMFEPHIVKQLTHVLHDNAPHYDATLVVWQEKQIETLVREFEAKGNPYETMKARVQRRRGKTVPEVDTNLLVFEHASSKFHPILNIDPWDKVVQAWNPVTNTYYYAVENLEPEEFIKHGHLFVQTLNKLLKTPTSGLVHGAAIGLEGKGVLLCARGQRGKSTLAVRAMLDGFDYVSDDYLVLDRDSSGLHASPIYSIITLSAPMYGDLYPIFDGKFVSNNARKDKYVFNISAYHKHFMKRYPIKLCMFPQIVSAPEPNIVECTQAGKGRAIVQLIHSTINQMGDNLDIATVKKLLDFVKDLPCYQINLCRDIEKNLLCLREFLKSGKCERQVNAAGILQSRSQPPAVFGR